MSERIVEASQVYSNTQCIDNETVCEMCNCSDIMCDVDGFSFNLNNQSVPWLNCIIYES